VIEIPQNYLILAGITLAIALVFQILLALAMTAAAKSAARERSEFHREMFGLLKKLEGLTANKREQILKHYDTILENLSNRLPPTIAAQASKVILDTESRILSRLAELEPNLMEDESSRRKMDELIKSMENLEETIVGLTAQTVRSVLVDSRRNLLDDGKYDESLAA
jgi:uncharacterized protein YoxC